MKKKLSTILLLLMLVFTVTPAVSAQDNKLWVDMYYESLNGYQYYKNMISSPDGAYTGKYRLYRFDETNYKEKKLCTVQTASLFGRFVTNGKEILNIEDIASGGARVDVLGMDGKKKRTIANLKKYGTPRSTDTFLTTYIYDGYLYYSKKRGLSTYIYGIYKVNIKTGKETLLTDKFIMEPKGYLPVYTRYVPVKTKNGTTYMLDLVKKKTVKMGGSEIFHWTKDGDYFYTLQGKQSGSKWNYTVIKRKPNGKAVSTIAKFSCSCPKDWLLGFTTEGVDFNAGISGDTCYEYNFKKKKGKKTDSPSFMTGSHMH